ncbi:MAG: ComEC/Rec2 family competence protein [Patescibacteria group bacterium]|nr:ComEC/Rec2 family competence protein [Patescibacteria group bacterium]MCL5432299.1 ComEC/Rec2 family competence protein [Patescibacteria group bacterium]
MRWLFISFLFVTLLLRVWHYWQFDRITYVVGQQVTLEGELGEQPTVDQGRQVFMIDQMRVYAPLAPVWQYGDRLKTSGTVACSGSCLTKVTVELVASREPNWWVKTALAVRGRFTTIYREALFNNQAQLLSGIVLGSIGLDRQFKIKLANVGLTHVVAASGMNVSLFSGFVIWLINAFRPTKIVRALLIIISIGFYCTITGFAPPIVRATIMAVVALLGEYLGRQKAGLVSLLTAAYLMLWALPELLVSASFLLSFTSMASQIFLSSLKIKLPNVRQLIIENFLQSFLAITFTLPIILIFFTSFSLVSLITNVLVLWTVEPLMILGGFTGLVGVISIDLARLVMLPASVLLDFFLWVVNAFGSHPEFLLKITGVDLTFVFGYYLLLGGLILGWSGRKRADVV